MAERVTQSILLKMQADVAGLKKIVVGVAGVVAAFKGAQEAWSEFADDVQARAANTKFDVD